MSADRLREMLSEATPAPWRFTQEDGLIRDAEDYHIFRVVGSPKNPQLAAAARLVALAPDAIALLADAADLLIAPVTHRNLEKYDDFVQRLDALCGDER